MNSSLLDLVRELNTLNDDNLADRVIANSDVQWCLSELQDILEAEQPTLTPPNEALTLEQLREMDGEPVWVKCLKPNKYIKPPVRWRILEKSITGTFGVWDGEDSLIERNDGTDWLAYRRPPEEEEDA